MDRDVELLADLVGKSSDEMKMTDIRSLVGRTGSMSSTRHGVPPVKCVIKAIEIDHDIKLVVRIGKQTIRRHVSKFSWEIPAKKPIIINQDREGVKCICGQHFKNTGRHRRECPIRVLGLDRSIRDMQDLIDEE